MDKFSAYFGYTIFWWLLILTNVDYWFLDGDFDTYMCMVAMANLWMWIKYRLERTHVTRHIVHLPYEENDDLPAV